MLDTGTARPALVDSYRVVRAFTETLARPLRVEDCVVQSMPDASPTKWHLAHTSWFFETFVLQRGLNGYQPFDARYATLFNSYYQSVGDRHPRPQRGLLSRPTVREVLDYRQHVDRAVERFLLEADAERLADRALAFQVGLNHEQQHQELILTDIKHVLASNPLEPVYSEMVVTDDRTATGRPMTWHTFAGGVVETGHAGTGFAFDNEMPRHRVFLAPFEMASRPVTCAEYLEFIADGGYERPELWLSDGWDACRGRDWCAPLYWRRATAGWEMVTLGGARAVRPREPVCHVSLYEADAYARWAGARLPLEAEWEHAAESYAPEGNFVDSGLLHPAPARQTSGQPLQQLFGDVWEWTGSPYRPYPGYAPFPGALAEYNGKFMSGQFVLRGGSCASPASHLRASYRNFFPPDARWQFSGIRLARGPA